MQVRNRNQTKSNFIIYNEIDIKANINALLFSWKLELHLMLQEGGAEFAGVPCPGPAYGLTLRECRSREGMEKVCDHNGRHCNGS